MQKVLNGLHAEGYFITKVLYENATNRFCHFFGGHLEKLHFIPVDAWKNQPNKFVSIGYLRKKLSLLGLKRNCWYLHF